MKYRYIVSEYTLLSIENLDVPMEQLAIRQAPELQRQLNVMQAQMAGVLGEMRRQQALIVRYEQQLQEQQRYIDQRQQNLPQGQLGRNEQQLHLQPGQLIQNDQQPLQQQDGQGQQQHNQLQPLQQQADLPMRNDQPVLQQNQQNQRNELQQQQLPLGQQQQQQQQHRVLQHRRRQQQHGLVEQRHGRRNLSDSSSEGESASRNNSRRRPTRRGGNSDSQAYFRNYYNPYKQAIRDSADFFHRIISNARSETRANRHQLSTKLSAKRATTLDLTNSSSRPAVESIFGCFHVFRRNVKTFIDRKPPAQFWAQRETSYGPGADKLILEVSGHQLSLELSESRAAILGLTNSSSRPEVESIFGCFHVFRENVKTFIDRRPPAQPPAQPKAQPETSYDPGSDKLILEVSGRATSLALSSPPAQFWAQRESSYDPGSDKLILEVSGHQLSTKLSAKRATTLDLTNSSSRPPA
ncbi:adenylate cyclase, terminal-differentiation specific-like [Trichogramma pretiosum]|uniref:adenylate cyclase, terminal-differentiation specific-like n=1 Tax=Trichogramma pretiosum TaxID=7493 RepID=UPI000C718D79|nr:adenylate cyclase, terminal-differentiation specific-like [Trichogramma pretiosum]